MTRLIKRYGSRKLYDTTESRYILLEDIAEYVRLGEEIQVVDNKTSEDVTSQTLTQVISEEGRKKSNFLSSELLHDLIRAGESAVNNRVRQIQDGMDRFVKKSFDRLVPLRSVRDEMDHLRNRLEELEGALSVAEKNEATRGALTEETKAEAEPAEAEEKKAAPARKLPRKRTSTKTSSGKTTASKTGTSTRKTTRTTTRKTKTTASQNTEAAAESSETAE